MAVATHMPVEELGVALGVYCQLFNVQARAARKELDMTQRDYFDEGWAWASSNAHVIKRIKDDPQAIAAGRYSLSEARGWLSRLLGIGRPVASRAPAEEELEAMARNLRKKRTPADEARAKRMAELSELVDESLASGSAGEAEAL